VSNEVIKGKLQLVVNKNVILWPSDGAVFY